MSERERLSLGIIGNLSNRGGADEPRSRARFVDVDRDELDAVFERLAPAIHLELPFLSSLCLSAVDDFHPDPLSERVPALASLIEARESVDQPGTMRRLIEEAGADASLADTRDATAPKTSPPPSTVAEVENGGALLDAIVAEQSQGPEPGPRARSADPDFDRLIAEIAEASTDRTDYEQQDRWRSAIDRELAARVRAILHHTRFQQLEATWRALGGLVRAIDDAMVRIRILDISQENLLAELDDGADLEETTLHRLVDQEERGTRGGDPFDLLVGDFFLETGTQDLRLLRHLGEVARSAQVPLVAGAGASLLEVDPQRQRGADWEDWRRSETAGWVGLCAPRVLLRLPYGPATEPVDRFDFDEEVSHSDPSGYLWGNPAYLFARAAAEAFARGGSLDALPRHAELSGLPLHVYRANGVNEYLGPTERILPDREIEALIERGLIPLAGLRGGDSARIMSLRSIAGTPLI